MSTQHLSEQEIIRREKLDELKKLGIDAYPAALYPVNTTSTYIKENYKGIRPAPGYPACPDLDQQVQLCELLDPARIGVELSEEFQLHPEQSTSAIIVHHPEAKYFNAN